MLNVNAISTMYILSGFTSVYHVLFIICVSAVYHDYIPTYTITKEASIHPEERKMFPRMCRYRYNKTRKIIITQNYSNNIITFVNHYQ